MTIELPITVLHIVKTLTSSGYTCEIVGGAVRDLLLGVQTSDWDFTTNATPEQILPLFTESFYENQFGTVMVAQKHLDEQFQLDSESLGLSPDLVYDITTYRSDGEYRNHRKPESVVWGKTIAEDLQRRDFTINAIAFHVRDPLVTPSDLSIRVDVDIIDPFQGEEDMRKKLVRTVGVPDERFSEDALRIMRAVRFANQFQFAIESETLKALQSHVKDLSVISMERMSSEFMKMIASPTPDVAIVLLDKLEILPYILPELGAAKGVRQSGHHIYDVWEHSLRALGSCTSSDPVVRLATLLHDIGKPTTYQETPDGSVTFYNHEVIGARIAKQIGSRLRLSKRDCDRLFTLVRWHMFTYESFTTDAYIRRFIRRVGTENLEDIFALRVGDRVGSGSKASSWRLEELKERVWAELHQPMKITDMVIDGRDVMTELGIKPGPMIGKVLSEIFEEVFENPELNERETLLKKIQGYKDATSNSSKS